MLKKNLVIHFRVINVWLGFILFLIVISNLPHEAAPMLSWVNCSIYFLLFLQAFYLVRNHHHNRDIFFNIAIFALFHSLSFAIPFFGQNQLLGSDYLAFYFFAYLDLIQSFAFIFCVVYLCIKYLFKDEHLYVTYGLTLAVVIPVFLWQYFPFLFNKTELLELVSQDAMGIERRMLYTNFLPLFFIVLYGVILYRYDRSLGAHINNIVVCFFIMLIMDMTNLAGYVFRIAAFPFTQYVLLMTLSFFIVTMFRLLNYARSEFAQFYETLVRGENYLGVPIKRKQSLSLPVLDFARAYFHQRKNTVGFLTLVFFFCINIFHVSLFVKVNLGVLSFGLMVLFVYLSALYQKRLRNGNLLTLRRSNI